MKLSVVIPVFNEESTIEDVIREVRSVPLDKKITREIVIVNDGSTDQTQKILQKYLNDDIVKIFHLEHNSGKTAALVRGIEKATGDVILIQDADLEYNPREYPVLLEPILSGQAQVVYGSRFKGSIEKMTRVNRISNILSNMTFNILYRTHLTDINTCYKAFRKEALRGITITSKDFTFETEITAKLWHRGVKIVEVPIHYVARSQKQGKKIRWDTALHMYWGMIKYRFRSRT